MIKEISIVIVNTETRVIPHSIFKNSSLTKDNHESETNK